MQIENLKGELTLGIKCNHLLDLLNASLWS